MAQDRRGVPPALASDAKEAWLAVLAAPSNHSLAQRVVRRTSMPNSMRGKCWLRLSGGGRILERHPHVYKNCLEDTGSTAASQTTGTSTTSMAAQSGTNKHNAPSKVGSQSDLAEVCSDPAGLSSSAPPLESTGSTGGGTSARSEEGGGLTSEQPPSAEEVAAAGQLFGCSYDYLRFASSAQQQRACLRVLAALRKHHPSISFCPAVPTFTAMCLHWMSEREAFATVSSLLERRQLIDTRAGSWARLHTLERIGQRCMPDHYRTFCAHFGLGERGQHLSQQHPLSGGVLGWLCDDLPFWTSVRLMDMFITEGRKIWYKAALAVLETWYLYHKGSFERRRGWFPARMFTRALRRRGFDKDTLPVDQSRTRASTFGGRTRSQRDAALRAQAKVSATKAGAASLGNNSDSSNSSNRKGASRSSSRGSNVADRHSPSHSIDGADAATAYAGANSGDYALPLLHTSAQPSKQAGGDEQASSTKREGEGEGGKEEEDEGKCLATTSFCSANDEPHHAPDDVQDVDSNNGDGGAQSGGSGAARGGATLLGDTAVGGARDEGGGSDGVRTGGQEQRAAEQPPSGPEWNEQHQQQRRRLQRLRARYLVPPNSVQGALKETARSIVDCNAFIGVCMSFKFQRQQMHGWEEEGLLQAPEVFRRLGKSVFVDESVEHASSYHGRVRLPDAPGLDHPCDLMSQQDWAPVWQEVPMRHRLATLVCVFDSDQDGNSFTTLMSRAREVAPMLLLLRTQTGVTIGAFITATWAACVRESGYQGTGESFVFSNAGGSMAVYPWSGDGAPAQLDAPSLFATVIANAACIGGGPDGHAIELDPDLHRGVTSASPTFDSPPLLPGTGSRRHFVCTRTQLWCLGGRPR